MYHAPNAPLPIGGVLDDGFALFRASFGAVFPLAVIGALVSAPLNRAAQAIVVSRPDVVGGLAVLALSLVVVALTTIFMAAIVSRIDRVAAGERQPLAAALGLGLERLPALIAAGVIYIVAVSVGLVLLVVPGLFISIAWLFFYLAVIVDRKGPIEALRHSWQLVRGRWWRTSLLVGVVCIVLGLIYVVLGVIAGLVIVLGTDATFELEAPPWYLDFLVMPLIVGFVGPLGYAQFVAIYRDLSLRHAAADAGPGATSAADPSGESPTISTPTSATPPGPTTAT